MAHVLILGMTESGKTTLAKKILKSYRDKNISALVLDPLCDPDWSQDGTEKNFFQTDDQEDFLRKMYASRSCALFIDESGASIGRYAGPMAVVATQSRHFGHKAHFITQRAVQLDRTIRDQCSTLFVFRVGKKDADTLAEEFGYDELKTCNELAQGECFKVSRFSAPEKFSVF
jgi:DNA helicase HerA-like ATPase